MIPSFKDSSSMLYLVKIKESQVLHRSDCPNDVVYEDLIGYDRAFFLLKKRHAFAGIEEKGKYLSIFDK